MLGAAAGVEAMSQGDLFSGRPQTLNSAREALMDQLHEGVVCPCCDQYAKVYRRKLNSGMVRALIWLVRQSGQSTTPGSAFPWTDVPATAPTWVQRSRELPKLAYWEMIEQRWNDADPTKRCSGIWRPTRAGERFARSEVPVSSHVYVYNGSVVGRSDRNTWVREALGVRFDYGELMGHERKDVVP